MEKELLCPECRIQLKEESPLWWRCLKCERLFSEMFINAWWCGYNVGRLTLRALDKVPVRIGDACPTCGGCDVQCAECITEILK